MGVKPISKTFRILDSTLLSLSLNPSLSSFYSPSPCSLQRRWEKKGGVEYSGWGGMVYLTLICPVVSFREMTCNLRGKGQLFLFPSSESQFTAPGDFFSKAANYFRFCHIVFDSLSWKLAKGASTSTLLSLFPAAH